jgi:hypothetical protein
MFTVARVRSVAAKVPWRLAAKALVAAFAWYVLPFWLFVLLALGLYFIPIFRPFPLFVPFLALLFLAGVLHDDVYGAAFVGAAFFLLLGVKDLVLAKRHERYAALVALLALGLGIWFFAGMGRGQGLFSPLILGAMFFAILQSYMRVLDEDKDIAPELRLHLRTLALVASLLLAEWTWALLLLPFSETHRVMLFVIPAALTVSLVGEYAAGGPSRRSAFAHAAVFIGSLVLVLAAAQWGI